ncbi:unnamed protein product [Lepeophtheirus salmonis]|uniref:(salmon louse) hypothetical protein n=1 Tax=Lepeophtheirus salmonis TaxID=72036 RepID=A0A7R8CYS7_LEPSM|nr:unnamed protein product [Lepeophtheirus salmonis]CAF2971377.1 unnamed protein product [Lepeophtheirus salmonis]
MAVKSILISFLALVSISRAEPGYPVAHSYVHVRHGFPNHGHYHKRDAEPSYGHSYSYKEELEIVIKIAIGLQFLVQVKYSTLYSIRLSVFKMSDLVLFPDTANLRVEIELLKQCAEFDEEEIVHIGDLRRFASGKVDGWVMDSGIRDFVNVLLSRESLPSQVRVRVLRLLALCALRPEFGNFLALDRKERRDEIGLHIPMSGGDSRESNLKVATNLAALSLVSYTPSLQDIGSGLILNLASIEVKGIYKDATLDETDNIIPCYNSVADVDLNGSRILLTSKATKLSAATMTYSIFKYLSRGANKPTLIKEDIVFRCIKALLKFVLVIPLEVEEGEAIIPVDWSVIRDLSERIFGVTDMCKDSFPTSGRHFS